jgi:hypothetical protein
MTILSAAQSAGIRLQGQKPGSLFSPSGLNVGFANELADLATEIGVDIMKAHDWRALTNLCTITGDGTNIGFNLPTDYDRMILKEGVHSATWTQWRFEPALDLDQWLDIQTYAGTGFPGWWIILGGQFQISQGNGVPLAAGTSARFYYVSKNIVNSNSAKFAADGDEFFLGDRLITLGLIWRWRAQKRQEYGEDLKNYEIALAQEIARDKGSRVLTTGRARMRGNIGMSYPGQLGS